MLTRVPLLLKLEPTARLLAALLLALAASVVSNGLGWWVIIIMTGGCYWLSGVRWQQTWRYLRPLTVFLILAILFGQGEGGRTLIQLGSWRYTTVNFSHGLAVAARLLMLVTAVAWFAISIQPAEAVHAFSSLLRPFKRVGVPNDDLAMAIMLASRFLPLTRRETQALLVAREARGAALSKGVRAAIRHITSLVIPLLASVLRRSDALAATLVIKGYRRGQNEPGIAALKLGIPEYLLVSISLLVVLIAFWN